MMAVAGAWARTFWRDLPGVALTLLLPPLVYLLFAAIFGAGTRGEIDASILLHDAARTPATAAAAATLKRELGPRLHAVKTAAELEDAVIDGRADAGVLIRASGTAPAEVIVVFAAGRDVAAAALRARLASVAAALSGRTAQPAPQVGSLEVGPTGDVQSAYYAGAVSVMFVVFAAMQGALSGIDERRSGLQARLVLARGGLAPILAGRMVWLSAVGVMQSVAVFAAAWPRLPGAAPWQIVAFLFTAALTGAAAAALALAAVAACRSRAQAQPLTTFIALLLAALGGSMAPRFLMPAAFRTLGWGTPHAWAIETYQTLLWRGRLDHSVIAGWAVLGAIAIAGFITALVLEKLRSARSPA